MRQSTHRLTISTRGKGFYEITAEVGSWLSGQGLQTGLLTLFLQHTSASLVIQENADPDVVKDLETFFSRLVREDDSLYTHTIEGPDDMPAHIRAALTQTQLSIPIVGRPAQPGNLAGDLRIRAPPPAASTQRRVARLRGVSSQPGVSASTGMQMCFVLLRPGGWWNRLGIPSNAIRSVHVSERRPLDFQSARVRTAQANAFAPAETALRQLKHSS